MSQETGGSDWACPACGEPVTAANPLALDWAVARHIRDHEDRASLHAVERARASCSAYACQIGKIAPRDKEGVPYPTDFDRQFLRGLKISWR